MKERRKNAFLLKKRPSILAFLSSLLLHIIFGYLLISSLKSINRENKPKYTKIELKFKERKKNVDKEEKDLNSKQIVSLNPDKEQKRPEIAKFLAEFNQSVKEEQKSMLSSLFPKKTRYRAENMGSKISLKAGALNKSDPLGLYREFDHTEALDDAMDFSDNLEKLKSGPSTALNAWQWQHAPFFNRLKQKVALNWSPKTKIMRYDPEGLLLGIKNLVTVLKVSINSNGDILDLSVINESGVTYLDEEAVEAFRRSSPFLFPPKELFADKDEFSFKFAFYLQVNRGVHFNISW